MPNFAKLAQELLSEEELALNARASKPAISALDDAGLMALIADLEARLAQAGTDAGSGDAKSKADILAAALRRAHAERRLRKLTPEGGARPAARSGAAAAPGRTAAAGAKPPAKAAAGQAKRKPAGRKPVAGKPDTRTTPRRVVKARPKAESATAAAGADAGVTAEAARSRPARLAKPDAAIAAKPRANRAETAPVREKGADPAKSAAVRDAEKDARKTARKAERQAEKDARKAEKEAEKARLKAERKVERKAANKAKRQAEKAGAKKAGAEKTKPDAKKKKQKAKAKAKV